MGYFLDRLRFCIYKICACSISTHTPARGATLYRRCDLLCLTKISTHTPARGATETPVIRVDTLNDFNSHAHEGRDIVTLQSDLQPQNFNSHAREGRDKRLGKFARVRGEFQLTRPRGARPAARLRNLARGHFNSHAREGRDSAIAAMFQFAKRFQLTRPRGARHNGEND